MHTFDCARIMHEIMEKTHGNITVNIGTKKQYPLSELVKKICKLSIKIQRLVDTNKPEGRFIKSSNDTYLKV